MDHPPCSAIHFSFGNVFRVLLELQVAVDRRQHLILVQAVVERLPLSVKPIRAYFRTNQHVGVRAVVESGAD